LHKTVFTYAQIADKKNQAYSAGQMVSLLKNPSAPLPKFEDLSVRYTILKRNLLSTAAGVRGQQEAWMRAATFQQNGFQGDVVSRAIALSERRSSMIGNIMMLGGAGALLYSISRK
jgi:hypothetical protein